MAKIEVLPRSITHDYESEAEVYCAHALKGRRSLSRKTAINLMQSKNQHQTDLFMAHREDCSEHSVSCEHPGALQ